MASGTSRALVEDNARDRGRRHQKRSGFPVIAEIVRDIDGDDAGTLARPGDVDADDLCMRDLAAQERDVQHARQFDVIDEQRLSGQELAIFIAFDRLAEGAGGHLRSAPHPFGRRHHRVDNVLIAGAATQIA